MAGTFSSALLNHSKFLSKPQQVGFTLLELLIVIFIISLISAGFIKLSVGFSSATQSLENETRRFHRLLGLTAQEAILLGGEIGILIEADAYRFVVPRKVIRSGVIDYLWETFDGDDMLQRHHLPQDWYLVLQQNGEVVPPVAAHVEKEEKKEPEELSLQPPPIIIFYASGEMTPFQLRIYAADIPDPSLIEIDEDGVIEMRVQEE